MLELKAHFPPALNDFLLPSLIVAPHYFSGGGHGVKVDP